MSVVYELKQKKRKKNYPENSTMALFDHSIRTRDLTGWTESTVT